MTRRGLRTSVPRNPGYAANYWIWMRYCAQVRVIAHRVMTRTCAQQVVDDIHSYVARGVTHFTFDLTGDSMDFNLEQLERISAEVLPNFR